MFEYQSKVMFIERINPMHVIELLDDVHGDINVNSSKFIDMNQMAKIKTVHRSEAVPVADMPWNSRYGTEFRGGSNTLLITSEHLGLPARQFLPGGGENKEVFMAFFHTKAHVYLETYFMGVLTFCSTPPFNIHSMSPYPIIPNEGMYQGPWLFTVDYVLYPSGLIFNPHNISEVILSYGHQDREAFLSVFDLYKLYNSLSFVANCSR